jgi:hypothetical protein
MAEVCLMVCLNERRLAMKIQEIYYNESSHFIALDIRSATKHLLSEGTKCNWSR